MRLEGKVAIVTGAASGIGRETALVFAREGATVIVADINREASRQVCEEISSEGNESLDICTDVTSDASVRNLAEEVVKRYGRVDVLFNNAGIGCVGALHQIDEFLWDRVMLVNVKGVYMVTKYIVPQMMQQQSGTIINMSSCIATTGLALRAGYAASKGAIYSMTKSMQVDYAPYNIRVNALMPGTIYTPFVENYLQNSYSDPEAALDGIRRRQLTGELGTPQDVAYAALYLASEESSFMLGAGLVIDGGLTAGK